MRIKQNYILVILFIFLIIFMNVQIFQKETIKQEGERIYFKLAPVDPRAFMLGDYMALTYEYPLSNNTQNNEQIFIISLDANNTVIDAQIYQDEALLPNQRLLNVQDHLRPTRFYFQEGYAKAYDNAEYGVFRYRSSNEFLLEDLANKQKVIINPLVAH